MVRYDSSVIQVFAQSLYDRARSIVITLTLLGIFVGGIAGLAAGAAISRDAPVAVAVLGALFGGIFGYAIGQARAFSLRLQAQTALCQVQIEENTRRSLLSLEVLSAPAVAEAKFRLPQRSA